MKKSDIDILVDYNGRIGIEFISLAHDLEEIFRTQHLQFVERI